MQKNSRERAERAGLLFRTGMPSQHVRPVVDDYVNYYDRETVESRSAQASTLTKNYYDLASTFYEKGWGRSFHFASPAADESLETAIRSSEQYLALRLGLQPHQRVLDIGCGIGGPMFTVARFSGASITGLNNNRFQIERAKQLCRELHLESCCELIEGDFTSMPIESASFDAAYVIEATCHAANRQDVFGEAYRILKPGACFAGYEWCLTRSFEPANPEHRQIQHEIEKGNALGTLVYTDQVDAMLRGAGFNLIESCDLSTRRNRQPWYQSLSANVSARGFLQTQLGGWMTHQFVRILENLRLAPSGTMDVHDLLRTAQRGLVAGGRKGIFTPMYFFLAQKPT